MREHFKDYHELCDYIKAEQWAIHWDGIRSCWKVYKPHEAQSGIVVFEKGNACRIVYFNNNDELRVYFNNKQRNARRVA